MKYLHFFYVLPYLLWIEAVVLPLLHECLQLLNVLFVAIYYDRQVILRPRVSPQSPKHQVHDAIPRKGLSFVQKFIDPIETGR